jgi:hypothetical protein
MKITLENPSRMVLLDHNYTAYIAGAGLFIIGGYFGVSYLSTNMMTAGAGGLFALIGIAIVATSKMLTITLDKQSGKGAIALKGIIGGGSRDIELSKVRKLTLRKQTRTTYTSSRQSSGVSFGSGMSSGMRIEFDYTIGFVMDTNEELPFKLANISSGVNNVLISPDEREMNFAKQISDFLGVPLDFVAPSSMGQTISTITQGMQKTM